MERKKKNQKNSKLRLDLIEQISWSQIKSETKSTTEKTKKVTKFSIKRMLINEIKRSTALCAVFSLFLCFFVISLSLSHNDVVVCLGLSFRLAFIILCAFC